MITVTGWISLEATEVLDTMKDLNPVLMAGGQNMEGFLDW